MGGYSILIWTASRSGVSRPGSRKKNKRCMCIYVYICVCAREREKEKEKRMKERREGKESFISMANEYAETQGGLQTYTWMGTKVYDHALD